MRGLGSKIVRYGFASGRVRVLETKMVSLARIKRLIEAETLDEVHKVIAETDYGPDLRAATTVAEVEAALTRHLSEAYKLLGESNIPVEMEHYFRSRYDFLNLRILIKSGFGRQIAVTLSDLGEVPAADVETMAKDQGFAGLTSHLEAAAREAMAKYGAERRFVEIDGVLDRHYFNNLLRLTGKLRSKWITGFTKLLIDLANGRITIRLLPDAGQVDIDDYLIEGGNIETSAWRLLPGSPDIAERLAAFPAGAIKDRLLGLALEGARAFDYDLVADNLAIDWLLTSHRFAVGPEPVFAYVAAREHEVKLLRLIISGHLSGLSPARLQERVTRIYG